MKNAAVTRCLKPIRRQLSDQAYCNRFGDTTRSGLPVVVAQFTMDEPTDRDKDTSSQQVSSSENDLFANILAPGSSLNPTFLLVVDGVLALLALTLLSLVVVTGGNVHLIALLFIELGLWASIKW
jgi:ER protein Pkr1